jgi:hypothetical protein
MQGPNLWRFYVTETLATSAVQNVNDTAYGSRLALARLAWPGRRGIVASEDDARIREAPYASPSVSNIAALMASADVLPAQTTNWKAG